MPDISIPYPVKGLHLGASYNNQPPGTTPDALNERSYDPILERVRGGQRNGTSKFFGTQINSSNVVQALDRAVALDATATNETVLWGSTSEADVSNTHHKSGLVMDPNDPGVVYSVNGPTTTATANVFKSSEDLVEAWGIDLLTAGTESPLKGTSQNLAISSDGLYLFVIGKAVSSKNLWVLSPTNGSTTASTLVNNDADADLSYIHAITKTDGTYRLSIVNQGASVGFFVVDYDPSDNSFTVVWADTGNLNNKARIGATEDIIYTITDTDGVRRYDISTMTLAWEHTIDFASGANDLLPDTNGNLYVCHQAAGSPTHDLVKLVDAGTSVSVSWKFDTSLANASGPQYMALMGDDAIIIGDTNQVDGIKTIDTSGTAAQTLKTMSVTGPSAATTGYPPHIAAYEPATGDIYAGTQSSGFNINTLFRLNPANVGITSRRTVTMAIAGGVPYQIISIPTEDARKDVFTGGTAVAATAFTASSTQFGGKFYICDGTSTGYRVATPSFLDTPTPTYGAWTLTAGSLPTSGSFGARLIELYRGRITMAGLKGEEQNIYFCAVGDPLNLNPAPSTASATQAVILNTGTAGVIGDVINSLAPHNDDLMVIGGDHTIHVLRGDPAPRNGGRIDLVTDVTGMWFGRCWTMSPAQHLYFMGTDGVYRMRILGDQISSPESVSGFRLDEIFQQIHTNRVRIQLAYSLRHKGVYVFVTNIASVESFAYFYCERTDSWHKDKYPNDHGPMCVLEHDGDDPKDRTILLGGRSGYVRRLDSRADDDDGDAIESYTVLPPIKPDGPGFNTREVALRRINVTLGKNTDSMTCEARPGDDAEAALTADAEFSHTFSSGGRRSSVRSRARGGAISLKLSNTTDDSEWAVEEITATVDPVGPIRV